MYVERLDRLNPSLVSAGGKARNLAQMIQWGMPVPSGFVILPSGFQGDQLSPQAVEDVTRLISQLWGQDPDLRLAVRSSAVAEDGQQLSFAGAFETLLNIAPGDSLIQAIEQVCAGRHSERAKAYAASLGGDAGTVAVIVQQMVPAQMAGVLFTVDPVQGHLQNMVGHAVVGLGDVLVSGEETGHRFQLARPHGKLSSRDPLPMLTPRLARKLYQYAGKLEEAFGCPQDMEWAIAGGQLFLLQSRPITTLQGYDSLTGSYNSSRLGEYLWTNSNFGEALPDPMTPATWSVIQVFMAATIPFDFLPSHPVVGNIGGRFYMNMTVMASLFMGLGFSRARLNRESEEFFGTLPDEVALPLLPLRFWPTIRRFLPAALGQMRRVKRNRARVASFAAALPEQVAALAERVSSRKDGPALVALWQQELFPLFQQICQMLQAGTSDYENRYRQLRRKLRKRLGEQEATTLLTGLSTGSSTLASLAPLLGLARLRAGELSLDAYNRQFGHRGPHEFELSLPRPVEDPDWVQNQLGNLAPLDPGELLARQRNERELVWQAVCERHPRWASTMAAKLDDTAAAARRREAIRSETVRVFGLIRSFYLDAGELLGLNEDVFFLEYPELLACLAGAAPDTRTIQVRKETHSRMMQLPPYPGIIIGRFDSEAWAADPHRRQDIFDARLASSGRRRTQSDDTLTGFPGASGSVIGKVRRLDRPEDGSLLQPGEILVTSTTNVGWTAVFTRAAAIITDVGAPLSHAAIVARELGIPAVVGTGNATRQLQDGDLVECNGGEGWVRRLQALQSYEL